MIRKILVPLDTSDFEQSVGIIPYVSYIAKGLDIPVVVASVLPLDEASPARPPQHTERHGAPIANLPQTYSAGVTPDKPAFEPGSSRPRRDAEETAVAKGLGTTDDEIRIALNRVTSRLAEDGVQVEVEITTASDIAPEILRLADRLGCDLIAMATHGRSLLAQAIKGSVTNEVLRSASLPVLAVTPGKNGPLVPEQRVGVSRILVPLDGSAYAETVLPYVEHIAKAMSLPVRLVRVLGAGDITPTTPGIGAPAPAGMGRAAAEAYNVAEDQAIKYLSNTAEKLAAAGIDVKWELLKGAPSASISDLAKDLGSTLITLAAHGRSGLARWVMGSVAEELLRETGDPVLVIPSQLAEEREER